jgi:hypothetical protein
LHPLSSSGDIIMTSFPSRLVCLGSAKARTRACLCGTMPEVDPELTYQD